MLMNSMLPSGFEPQISDIIMIYSLILRMLFNLDYEKVDVRNHFNLNGYFVVSTTSM